MPKAVNHVIFDGSPLIDLRSDTVTEPSHIMAGHVGHLADGSIVTGTGQGGGMSMTDTPNETGIGLVISGQSGGGGGGVSRETIVAEQTVTASEYFTALSATEGLVEGEPYSYTVDGTEYFGMAMMNSGMLYVNSGATFAIGDFNGNLFLVTQSTGQHTVTVEKLDLNGSGTPSATSHTVHLEFTDNTDTDITLYYDDPLLSTMITSYIPETYGQKTVDSAALDNVVWYTRPTETWETLLDEVIYFFPEGQGEPGLYPYCWLTSLGDVDIDVGSIWKVTYSGIEYRLVGTASSFEGGTGTHIGNPKYAQGADDGSGVPFLFFNTPYGAWTGGLESENTNVQAHFKIERLVTGGSS